jgi:hypothetical protein
MVGLDPAEHHYEVLRTYWFYRRMSQYPTLVGLMRSLLLEVLEEKGVVTEERVLEQGRGGLRSDGLADTEANCRV